jgi:Bacterial extracellular solute-binding protein
MIINHFRGGLVIAGILGFLVMPFVTSLAHAADVTVFAAASLKNALDEVATLYEAKTGDKIAISYAASPAVAQPDEPAVLEGAVRHRLVLDEAFVKSLPATTIDVTFETGFAALLR